MTRQGFDQFLISPQDAINIIADHMRQLDDFWRDDDHRPRKVHMIELLDAIKLRFMQVAEKNAGEADSTFERAAKRVTGYESPLKGKEPEPTQPLVEKTSMQLAHEAAVSRMRNRS